ncbi:GPI mannosyltransferase [Pseudozyma hubeiensis SY62]|uniref:GPI mannosyltransferase n=1 Tax=Pseudozyma hubeiensis (strain SY62) TaxID=1305764 RepID=R9PBH9_PSEHS|nr:GPI mannosyltransferase [Pseudozyma hubeiensis SY62]GAC95420.1 GPI mannosyltransferase [Pseudozyma hubeiensis SY62]
MASAKPPAAIASPLLRFRTFRSNRTYLVWAYLLSSPSLNLRLLRQFITVARFTSASFTPIEVCEPARRCRLRLRPLAIIFPAAAHQSLVNRIHPTTLVIDSA